MAGEFLELASQRSGETMGDVAGESVEEFALIFSKGTNIFAELLKFIVACLFQAVAQGGDEWNRCLCEEFIAEAVNLLTDDAFSLGEPFGAGRDVMRGSHQIVNIEERESGQFVDGAFDIARDGKIDDNHRAAGAMLHCEFEIGASSDRMWSRGCGDKHIHLSGNLPTVGV